MRTSKTLEHVVRVNDTGTKIFEEENGKYLKRNECRVFDARPS